MSWYKDFLLRSQDEDLDLAHSKTRFQIHKLDFFLLPLKVEIILRLVIQSASVPIWEMNLMKLWICESEADGRRKKFDWWPQLEQSYTVTVWHCWGIAWCHFVNRLFQTMSFISKCTLKCLENYSWLFAYLKFNSHISKTVLSYDGS